MNLQEKYAKDLADYNASRPLWEKLLSSNKFLWFVLLLWVAVCVGLYGCSAQPCSPVLVKVPVAACPAPAPIPAPHEWVYDLPSDASPDRVAKYSKATITELEAAVKQRDEVLETYRHEEVK